jgi:diguanylate cyclase (GGDEF)-like protein
LDDFQRQSDRDFILSARVGLVIQVLGWFTIVALTGFYSLQPILTLKLSWLVLVISLLRYTLIALHQYFYPKSSRLWMLSHYFLLFLHGIFWSGFYVYQISLDVLSPTLLATVLIVAVVTNGGVFSMRSKLVMPQMYLALLLLPAVYLSWSQPNLHFLSSLLFVFWLYLLGFSLRSHKQYKDNYAYQLNLAKNSQSIELKDKIDYLTKIYNRNFFEDCFEYQWQLAVRNGTDIALLMVDIDNFKGVNETYGVDYGNQCLIQIAEVIRQSAKRQTDMVVRYEGEEFVLILPDTEQAAAMKLAELIRSNLQFETFNCAGDNHTITASIGVGVVRPKQYSSPTLLLQKAEMALFQAKTQGRNRVELG